MKAKQSKKDTLNLDRSIDISTGRSPEPGDYTYLDMKDKLNNNDDR